MAQNYSGNTTGITGHPTVTISEPVGTDQRNAASVQTPLRRLADFLQYVATNAALLGANVFTATQQIATGDLELTNAAAQAILKATGGKLQIGTKTGNASDVELLVNGVVKAVLRVSDGRIGSLLDPVSAQDADTKAARDAAIAAAVSPGNALTDGKSGIVWNWTQNQTSTRLYKTAAGIVHLHIGANVPAGTPSLVATLPTGFRPEAVMLVPAVNATTNTVSRFTIGVDGTITCGVTRVLDEVHHANFTFKAA